MKDIFDFAESIETQQDFLRFTNMLISHYQEKKSNLDEWENSTLEDYLIGLSSFTGDINGYLFNNMDKFKGLPDPSWRLFATMLLAAANYE